MLALAFGLNLGDIAAPIADGDCPRRRQIFAWLSADPWGDEAADEAQLHAYWRQLLADREALLRRASAGEPVRIWADDTPHAACGLRCAAALLRELPCPVTVVRCPASFVREDGVTVEPIGWGEMEPERFGVFAADAAPLTAWEREELAEEWQRLQEENAPLRCVEGERVVSASVDRYDGLLLTRLGAETMRVAALIGRVLGCDKPGIGDWLLARRIEALLRVGRIVWAGEPTGPFYGREIRRG